MPAEEMPNLMLRNSFAVPPPKPPHAVDHTLCVAPLHLLTMAGGAVLQVDFFDAGIFVGGWLCLDSSGEEQNYD